MGTSKIYLCLDVGTGIRETLEMAFGRKELGNSGSVNVRSKIQFGQLEIHIKHPGGDKESEWNS